jgi:hypothetical protein
MKYIRNEIFISQKAYITHIYELHNYKGKLSSFFWVYNFLTKFQCGFPRWHDIYLDNVLQRSTLLEACLLLP